MTPIRFAPRSVAAILLELVFQYAIAGVTVFRPEMHWKSTVAATVGLVVSPSRLLLALVKVRAVSLTTFSVCLRALSSQSFVRRKFESCNHHAPCTSASREQALDTFLCT